MLPDLDRAERIGDSWANPRTRTFGELLIDCEEDRTLRGGWSGCCGRLSGKPARQVAGICRSAERMSNVVGNPEVVLVDE